MSPEFEPTPGSYMDRVDKAGGWEKYQASKEAEETMKTIASIPKEQWAMINQNVKLMRDFIHVDVQDFLTDRLTETITLKFQEALAPLKNEWNDLINTLLEPLMPFLEQIVDILVPIVQWIADGLQRILDDMFDEPRPEGLPTFQEAFVAWRRVHPSAPIREFLKYYTELLDYYSNPPAYTSYTDRGYQEF
jgi:hypothetical protein